MQLDTNIVMIIIILVLTGFMWWSGQKNKKRQQEKQDWRKSLKIGDEVATTSGLVGKVAELDLAHDQIVINSEGSLSRWRIAAIIEPPVVPKFVKDDEADENGNPISQDSTAPTDNKLNNSEAKTADKSETNESSSSQTVESDQ